MIRSVFFLGSILVLWCALMQAQKTPDEITCFIADKQRVQFAGMIIAQEKGIYEKYGLRVRFVAGDRSRASAMLFAGKTDFTVLLLPTAVSLRAGGKKIVNIAQLINGSTFLYLARKSSGIQQPQDIAGRKAGVLWGDLQIMSDAFFARYAFAPRPVRQGSSVNLFHLKGIDAYFARRHDEYHTLINCGIEKDELRVFRFADAGLGFPEDGLYCTESFYEKNKELCAKFARATLEGWKEAIEKPEESVDCIVAHIRKSNNPSNIAHVRWALRYLKEAMTAGNAKHEWGMLKEQDYLAACLRLKQLGLIPSIPAYRELHKGTGF